MLFRLNDVKRKEKIKDLYNSATPLWLNTWGDQMHHGYYEDPSQKSLDHVSGQIMLIQKLLQFANINQINHALDVGCGVGGMLFHLCQNFKCSGVGYNISCAQIEAGKKKLLEKDIRNVELICADATQTDFINDSDIKAPYDLAIALESIEHMENKLQVFSNVRKALAVKGDFLMSSWFLAKDFKLMSIEDQKLISNIFNAWYIPNLPTSSQYLNLLEKADFPNPYYKDVTENVVPFWKGVLESAFSWKSFTKIYTIRPSMIKGVWGVYQMYKAYEKGLLRYGFFAGKI